MRWTRTGTVGRTPRENARRSARAAAVAAATAARPHRAEAARPRTAPSHTAASVQRAQPTAAEADQVSRTCSAGDMQRLTIAPRAGWQDQARRMGFVYHTVDGEPYWDESACYTFSLPEIEDRIEA